MTLKGVEVASNLTGKALMNLATFLVAVLKEEKRSKGKTRIDSFNGKPTKVFMIRAADLKTFAAEAKKYGVLYAAIYDRKNPDGLCDVIVNATDAAKVNRIAERFALATVDVEQIRKDIEKDQTTEKTEAVVETAMQNAAPVSAEKSREVKEPELTGAAASIPEAQQQENPMTAWTGRESPSAPSSEASINTSNTTESRPSVRKELGEIKQQLDTRKPTAPSLTHTRPARSANSKSKAR
jgi:hypothetical protein